ncbi:response regulator transcription factor [Cohnella cellulosilytica]|uniref:Response regulator n=1 Tax=Cohnella cellulosilytica TaxID=986710 RepID=A0ABW2F849_9BACL
MYKVMIVEDEVIVRIGLKNSMDWSKYGMEVVADVSNGAEALAVYERDRPDLIVTDLKMPIMDGMELISAIRKQDQDTRILILSCLEEFEYARKAANLKVSGYILKLTMTIGEMEEVLASVREELRQRGQVSPAALNRRMNLETLKEKLIKDYLFYGVYSDSELDQLLKHMNAWIKPDRIMMAIVETGQHFRLLERFNDERGELIHFTVLNVLNEILAKHRLGEAFHDRDNRYMLLLSFEDPLSEEELRLKLNELLDNIRKAMNTYFNVPVFGYVSSLGQGFASWKKMYQQCSEGMSARYFSASSFVFASDRVYAREDAGWKEAVKAACARWERLGGTCRRDLQREVELRMERQPPYSEAEWKRLLAGLADWTCRYLGLPEEQDSPSSGDKIMGSPTIHDSVQVWETHLEETAKLREAVRSVSKEVADAVQYVHRRYDQNLSLRDISDYVRLSPNYLSLLFKKEMGMNLIEYLTEYRIDKAKELLRSTSLKTYEIADNVGVKDSAYFSRIFKKTTGMSPLEFRKKKVLGGRTDTYEDA